MIRYQDETREKTISCLQVGPALMSLTERRLCMRCRDAKQHIRKVELSRRRAERAELKLKRIERVSGEDWKLQSGVSRQ